MTQPDQSNAGAGRHAIGLRSARALFAGVLLGVAGGATAAAPVVAGDDADRPELLDALRFDPMPVKQPALWSLDWRDPAELIDVLSTRYRALAAYTERARVRAATVDAEGRPDDTAAYDQVLVGSFDHRGLVVEEPWSQALSGVSTAIGWRESQALREAAHARNLAMLPHLALRFHERPIDFLGGASGAPVVTTGSEVVTENARRLVRVDLDTVVPSAEGVHTSWELFVNPDSMLVERVDRRAREASGTETYTRIDIEPTLVVAQEDGDPAFEPGGVAGETTVATPPASTSGAPVLVGPGQRQRTDAPARGTEPPATGADEGAEEGEQERAAEEPDADRTRRPAR